MYIYDQKLIGLPDLRMRQLHPIQDTSDSPPFALYSGETRRGSIDPLAGDFPGLYSFPDPGLGTPRRRPKEARILIITDTNESTLTKLAPIYTRQVYTVNPSGNLKTVSSWKRLVTLLQEYKRIDRLVLIFHGIPGAIIIGNTSKDFNLITPMFGGTKPEIGEINFLGCSIAEQPDQLVEFAKFFNACKISAWTKFWVHQVIKGKGEWFRRNREKMKKYEDYMLIGTNYADLERRGNHTLWLEWFQDEIEARPLVTTQQIDSSSAPDRKTFKPRNRGSVREIAGEEQASKLRKEYDKAPITPFEHVAITLC